MLLTEAAYSIPPPPPPLLLLMRLCVFEFSSSSSSDSYCSLRALCSAVQCSVHNVRFVVVVVVVVVAF